ncbi:MAG: glycosyltransferase family 2 protein [Actinobacteria bacterium]|nr:glycosyltransferase family 2 protein [Actinomycetota bacterium]MBU2687417.1 glycosyltransferase family 2 protein [Actinomycetota bacterium]
MEEPRRDVEKILLSVVAPVYNEEENLEPLHARLTGVLEGLGCQYEVLFVDDGSTDSSLAVMRELAAGDPRVGFISFTRNFGHESATSAGLDFASGDAVVIMDADLQDPPEVIVDMVEAWRNGSDVVYGRRRQRAKEPALKRASSFLYYRLMRRIAEVDLPVDTGDFRLMDRSIVEFFKRLREKNRFVRAQVAWLTSNTAEVLYDRDPRHAGKTKYNFYKRLKLSIDSIVSFSTFPLRLMSVIGLIIFVLSLIGALVVFIQKLAFGIAIPGYTFLVISLFFLGGTQMLFLGIVGEYMARVYSEVKDRPLYLVASVGGIEERKPRGA